MMIGSMGQWGGCLSLSYAQARLGARVVGSKRIRGINKGEECNQWKKS